MQRLLWTLLVVTCMVITASCSKDDDGPTGNNNNNNNNSGAMSAKIDNGNWSAKLAEAYAEIDDDKIINLYGIDVTDIHAQNARAISITLENYHGTGTYTLTDEEDETYLTEVVNGALTIFGLETDDSGVGGEVVITEASATRVRGTFRCTLVSASGSAQRVITGGTFNLPVVEE